MIFKKTRLRDACLIEIEKRSDPRGFFARAWCQKEFKDQGLVDHVVQTNVSCNIKKGTLRGMHFQIDPYQETKLVRCTRGAIYDVIIDLRTDSPTYGEWTGVELTGENFLMLYVPKNFAHGFQTLVDDTDVTYQVTEFYTPGAERGLRYDDPAFKIVWPLPVSVISDKDKSWPAFAAGNFPPPFK
jgi:dTDP-4-dehydrorhamnose 3,5-epimerase